VTKLQSRGCGFNSQLGRYQVVTISTGKPSRYITNTKVNLAFHPSRVDDSGTGLELRWDAFTCVGGQVTLFDPIWQVMLYNSATGFPKRHTL